MTTFYKQSTHNFLEGAVICFDVVEYFRPSPADNVEVFPSNPVGSLV
jgi:hypothetical protein